MSSIQGMISFRRLSSMAALLPLLLTSGCYVATVSTHTMRDVAISITEIESGKPIGRVPIRVGYYYDVVSPLAFHYQFRTPLELLAEIDETSKAVIKVADYSGFICLTVDPKGNTELARFDLNRRLVRNGGFVDYKNNGRSLRLKLEPIKKPSNKITAPNDHHGGEYSN